MEGCDMDFSDIRTIIIGEAGEYGKRLVRYLEMKIQMQFNLCIDFIIK